MILSLGCSVFAASVNDYVDVPQNAWYRGAVDYVVQRGYMVGATANTFNPEGAVTRAQIAQIFYAMNGKPSAGTKPRFSDVSADAWYAAAVNWAATFGAVSGYPDGTYHPMEYISRQQLATIAAEGIRRGRGRHGNRSRRLCGCAGSGFLGMGGHGLVRAQGDHFRFQCGTGAQQARHKSADFRDFESIR